MRLVDKLALFVLKTKNIYYSNTFDFSNDFHCDTDLFDWNQVNSNPD